MTIVRKLYEQINDIRDHIERIQERCSHPDVTVTPDGDSGNVLTGREPSYWYHCVCNLCEKVWNQDTKP